MDTTQYFKAVQTSNIKKLIQSHEELIEWRKTQTQCNIVKRSIRFNERAIELLKANDIISYSIEYAKLKIPTPPGAKAYYISGIIRHNPSKAAWLQANRPPVTINVIIGSENDVLDWIRSYSSKLCGVYGVLEYQDQNAAYDDILGRVVI